MCVLGNVCIFRDLPYVVLQTYRVNSDCALRLSLLFFNLPTGICYRPLVLFFSPTTISAEVLSPSRIPKGGIHVRWLVLPWGGGSILGQTFAQLTHTPHLQPSRFTSQISLKYTLVFKMDSFFGNLWHSHQHPRIHQEQCKNRSSGLQLTS